MAFILLVIGFFVIIAIAAAFQFGSALKQADGLIDKHIRTLTRKRALLVRQDDYGNALPREWEAEVSYFVDTVLRPVLSKNAYKSVEAALPAHIDTACAKYLAEHPDLFEETEPADRHSGQEFELLCVTRLARSGWATRLTGRTGDQGIDIVAEKGGLRVAVQCKDYASPVGNGAVQEAYAGKKYWNTHHAAVVSRNGFTEGARQLSVTCGVLLLSEDDLSRLESLLQT